MKWLVGRNGWYFLQPNGDLYLWDGGGQATGTLIAHLTPDYNQHPELLTEALPTLLGRCGNLRVAFAGGGPMHGHLEYLAGQQGVGHVVRVLGDVPGDLVTKLLRASECLDVCDQANVVVVQPSPAGRAAGGRCQSGGRPGRAPARAGAVAGGDEASLHHPRPPSETRYRLGAAPC